MSDVAEATGGLDQRRFLASDLRQFSQRVLIAAGAEEPAAEMVTEALVRADLRGVDTHGVTRLPVYVDRMIKGGMQGSLSAVRSVRERGATALLDGGNCLGHVAAVLAMEKCIELCREHGIGTVGVLRSNHFGAAAHYAMMASEQGMIGLVTTHTAPIMAPSGGAAATLGNNPIAIAVPAGDAPPVVLDMALSNVAGGQLRMAAKASRSIPSDWVITADGQASTDPEDYVDRGGALLPLGGHKGSGLSVITGLLAGALTGPFFGSLVRGLYEEVEEERVGHFFIAIDVASFCEPAEFGTRVQAYLEEIKGTRRAKGVAEIFFPGEIEWRREREREREGIPLLPQVVRDLNQLAVQLGVAPLTA